MVFEDAAFLSKWNFIIVEKPGDHNRTQSGKVDFTWLRNRFSIFIIVYLDNRTGRSRFIDVNYNGNISGVELNESPNRIDGDIGLECGDANRIQ